MVLNLGDRSQFVVINDLLTSLSFDCQLLEDDTSKIAQLCHVNNMRRQVRSYVHNAQAEENTVPIRH